MHYYNEFDPQAAAWLQVLIDQHLIPEGVVDTRSIVEVTAADLGGFVQCHFFAGIGGWPLALQLAGVPASTRLWTGSCPCQPFSVAGEGKGTADERHLWPVFFDLIRACNPPLVFGEQVASAAVIGKAVQKLRSKKAGRPLPDSQQGWVSWDLPGLRESQHPRKETVEFRGQEELPSTQANYSSGIRADTGSPATSRAKGNPVQSGLEGDSNSDRRGLLRSDGASLQPEYTEVVGCSVDRPDEGGGGLLEGQHESGSLRVEYDGQRVGRRSHHNDCSSDSGSSTETVIDRIERLIGEDWRTTKDQPQQVWLDGVQSDLEGAHYAFGSAVMAACSVSAPHIRQRCWWGAVRLADSDSQFDNRAGNGRSGRRTEFADGGADERMADSFQSRLEGHAGNVHDGNEPGWNGTNEAGSVASGGESGWKRVSFAADCLGGDEEEFGDECSICGLDYTDDCECPGPTQDGYEYDERDGILYARRLGDTDSQSTGRHTGSAHAAEAEHGTREGDDHGFVDAGNGLSCGMGIADRNGRQSRLSAPKGPRQRDPAFSAGFWDDAYWHPCRDGKYRRVPTQSVFQHVVNELSGRVDLGGDFSPEEISLIAEAAQGFPLASPEAFKVLPRGTVRPGLLKGSGNAIVPQVAAEFIKAFYEVITP